MFIAFYIVVALLQFSIGQDAIQYESEIPEELDTAIPFDYTGEDTIRYIETVLFEGNNDSKTIDEVSETSEDVKDENVGDTTEPISVVYATQIEQEEITTATSSDDDNNDFTSSEEVRMASEPISFGGCAKANGKVTIAAHFGCGVNSGNVATEGDLEVPIEVFDEPVSFEGPVHAQGKVIVGSHYGCGGPIGIPPVFLPWYPSFYHPQIYYPYPIPVFSAHYPFPILETNPFTVFQDHIVNEYDNFQDLPVASNLANSVNGDQNGIPFNGVVPAAGTVSIAARF